MGVTSHREIGLIKKYGGPSSTERTETEKDPQEKLTDAEEGIDKTLVKQMNQSRPAWSDFNYPKGKIQGDQERLANKQARQKPGDRRPRIFEAILWQETEQSEWFGPNCTTVATSEFDDQLQGTDLILEFEQEDGSVVRLAVDATLDTRESYIRSKKSRIVENLEDGRLGNLDYFYSEDHPQTKGKLSGVPQIILGIDKKTVQNLSKMIVDGKHRELADSEVQICFLEEAREQLEILVQYATDYFRKRRSPVGAEIITKHKEVLEIIKEVLENKKRELSETREIRSKDRNRIFGLITDWSKEQHDLEIAA